VPDLRDDVRDLFTAVTGLAPAGIWSAPGRLELPTGAVIMIDRRAVVAAGGRDDDRVRIISATAGEVAEVALGEVDDALGQADWIDAVLAAFAALRAEGGDLGAVPGVDLAIDSTVPEGVGLGSRAAVRDAVLPALRDLWRLPGPASTPAPETDLASDDEALVVIAAGADGPDDPVLALAAETARDNGATTTYPIGDGSLLTVLPADAESRLRVAIDGAFAEHGWGSPELFTVRPSLGPRRDA
jgi:hypothetical protein